MNGVRMHFKLRTSIDRVILALARNLFPDATYLMTTMKSTCAVFYLSPFHEHIRITNILKAHEKLTGKGNFSKNVENSDFKKVKSLI